MSNENGNENGNGNELPRIRNRKTIDLSEYGGRGTIILEDLTPRRKMEYQDRVGECTIYNPDGTYHRKL